MSKKKKSLFVDIDAAVDGYNSKPENKDNQVSKYKFQELWGVSHQTIMNWQNGRSLGTVEKLDHLIELSGLPFAKLVIRKKQ